MRDKDAEIEGIGYIRQSDEREDKEDISEQTQLAKIQAYCDFNNIKLVKVFKDIDYSGFRISYTKRPGIMDALHYCKERPTVKKFVIFNLSRLTRRKGDFQLIQTALTGFSVDICSASELLDFGSATGRLVTGILVDFNEYYSDNLSDVVNENKKTNAIKGRWNGGPAPYGIKKTLDGFKKNGEKAVTIRNMFDLALQGKGPYIISNWLSDHKIFTETGKEWTPRRVRYVLTNPSYAAIQEWKGEYYPLENFEKIVTWDEFQYVQATLFGKEKVWRGKERQLLSSVLRCPICGSKMHSKFSTSKKSRKYVCSKKNTTGRCSSPNLELYSLNNAVVNLISDLAKQRFSSEDIIPEIDTDNDNNASSIKKLQAEMSQLEVAKQKVFDDYYLNSKFSEDQFSLLMKRYDKRQSEISDMLQQIPLPSTKGYGNYDDVLNDLSVAFDELPDGEQRKSIELLVDEILPGTPTVIRFKWGEEIVLEPIETTKYNQRLFKY